MSIDCNISFQQSSWSKRAVVVDSPQPMSPWDDLADPPDSTCAQVIHSRPEAHSSNLVPVNATRKAQKCDDDPGSMTFQQDKLLHLFALSSFLLTKF